MNFRDMRAAVPGTTSTASSATTSRAEPPVSHLRNLDGLRCVSYAQTLRPSHSDTESLAASSAAGQIAAVAGCANVFLAGLLVTKRRKAAGVDGTGPVGYLAGSRQECRSRRCAGARAPNQHAQ